MALGLPVVLHLGPLTLLHYELSYTDGLRRVIRADALGASCWGSLPINRAVGQLVRGSHRPYRAIRFGYSLRY